MQAPYRLRGLSSVKVDLITQSAVRLQELAEARRMTYLRAQPRRSSVIAGKVCFQEAAKPISTLRLGAKLSCTAPFVRLGGLIYRPLQWVGPV